MCKKKKADSNLFYMRSSHGFVKWEMLMKEIRERENHLIDCNVFGVVLKPMSYSSLSSPPYCIGY